MIMPVEKTIITEHVEETEKETWEASGRIFNDHSFEVAVVEKSNFAQLSLQFQKCP